MKIDIDMLTIIDDETIRMEENPPRQEGEIGRNKLEQFGWKVIEPPSESSEDGEKWIVEKNSYPIPYIELFSEGGAIKILHFTYLRFL
ncbi:MAG: hypothetical protein R6U96_02385 [Promethearchaeia archaeon]